jgi:hypothetical protein
VISRMELYSRQPSASPLPLGGFMPSDDPVFVRNIDGLGPVKADINTTELASGRDELFQNSKSGKRNIVITLGLNPDWVDQTMSSLRHLLYRYLIPTQWCKLRFIMDDLPTCDIEGYVESFDPNMFSEDPEIQVSIICPKPDFVDVDATVYTGVVDDGTAEFEFNYEGDVDTGYELRVEASDVNVAYNGGFTIKSVAWDTEQILTVTPVIVDLTKYFKMSSLKGNKRLQTIQASSGAITNLLAKMSDDSVWPVLLPGENVFSIAAEETGQIWTLAYFNRFGGL